MSFNTKNDTKLTKIFVGGLPYHTTDQSLREFFEQFGGIKEAVVITDRQTGKSRGYGFVTMSDSACAEKACEDPNPIIDERKANVNLAYLGAKPRVMPTGFPDALPMKYDMPSAYATQVPMVPQYRYVYPGSYLGAPGIYPATHQQLHSVMTQQPQPSVSPTSSTSGSGTPVDGTSTPVTTAYATMGHLPNGYAAAYQYTMAANQLAHLGYPYVPPGAATHPTVQQLALHSQEEQQLRLQQAQAKLQDHTLQL